MLHPAESIPQKPNNRLRWIAILSSFEAIITLVVLFLIPPDPKNAFLFGLSWKRWLIVLVAFMIFLRMATWAFRPGALVRYAEKYQQSLKTRRFIDISGIVVGILLWLAIWFPALRLGVLSDDYLRVRPLIILFLVICLQLIFILKNLHTRFKIYSIFQKQSSLKRLFLIFAGVIVLVLVIFVSLQLAGVGIGSTDPLYFPPSSILTPLQVFSAWLLFFLGQRTGLISNGTASPKKKWVLAGLFLIWALTFLLWFTTPLPCTGDRPGPDTPNNQCYPPIDDSVYSIGSLYVGLGEGVYNHWLTDKPLYLLFLAAGQAIFGPNIDRYMIFQILILATIPALVYYFSKRYLLFSGSLMVAALMVLKGFNEIRLYSSVGGMNVKIENTEGLMTLLLILLTIVLFQWFQTPTKNVWGVIAGGVLGLGVLVRFNPIAILPIILAMFLWKNKKNMRKVWLGSALFLATFLLTTLPWFITARDENGVSFYYQKIQEVIDLRFNSPETKNITPGVAHLASPDFNQQINASEQSSQTVDFFLHFLNNEVLALTELPVNFFFHTGETIADQPLWDIEPLKPIWMVKLSLENYLAIGINLIFVLFGIAFLFQHFGQKGLIPLLVQIGYFLGNSAAMTSGERYLMPVGWVTLIYYCIGLLFIAGKILQWIQIEGSQALFALGAPEKPSEVLAPGKFASRSVLPWMAVFLLIGFLPYLVNFLPKKLALADSEKVHQQVQQVLLENDSISQSQWESFLEDPNAVVVQVKAYHPRNYRNKNYFPGMVLFELMALEKSSVYVSHMVGQEAKYEFSDGSDVILAGCKVGTDVNWNASRILMRTNVVLQLSHEKSILIDPNANWDCTP